MTRIAIPTKDSAPAQSKPTLERYERNLGIIPNFFSLICISIWRHVAATSGAGGVAVWAVRPRRNLERRS